MASTWYWAMPTAIRMTLDGGRIRPTVIPAQAGIQSPGRPGVAIGRGVDSRFRGNDGGVVCFHMALSAYGDSPSPNPLPLGEGFSLGSGSGFAVMAGLGIVMMAGYRDAG